MEETDLTQIRTVELGPWEFQTTDRAEFVTASQVNELQHALRRWQEVFSREDTLAQREFNVPSLLVRVDCTPTPQGLRIYEVEERPSGLGVASTIAPGFATRLRSQLQQLPPFQVVVSPQRGWPGTDDFVWATAATTAPPMGAVLVRAEPEESGFHSLAPRSISAVREKGNKDYGVALGWWQLVTAADVNQLPWDQGFCLKPIQGSKCRGVEIFAPAGLRPRRRDGRPGQNGNGTSTRTRVTNALIERGQMYLQPLIRPQELLLNGAVHYATWRIFFCYGGRGQWRPLGGVWVARPETYRLHGAKDSVAGPLVLDPATLG